MNVRQRIWILKASLDPFEEISTFLKRIKGTEHHMSLDGSGYAIAVNPALISSSMINTCIFTPLINIRNIEGQICHTLVSDLTINYKS